MKYLFVVASTFIYAQAFSQRDSSPMMYPYLQKIPILSVKTEPSITLIPSCLIDCPILPDTFTFHSCRGRALIIIDGVKVRGRSTSVHVLPEPAVTSYRGLTLRLEGFPADKTGFPASLQPAEFKRYLLTPRTYPL